jgi:hypothetical protein
MLKQPITRWLLLLLAIILVACQQEDSSGANFADELPLADDRPTFAFFYTDN